jgi:hypothetical protein
MADKTYNFTVGGRQFEIEGPEGMSEQAQREAVEDHLAVQPQQTLRFDGTGNLVDFAKQLPVGFARGIEGLPGVGPSLMAAGGRQLEQLGVGDQEAAAQREDFAKRMRAGQANIPPRNALERGMAYLGRLGQRASAQNLLPAPQTPGGQYGASIGEFAAGAAGGPGRWLSKVMTAIAGGVGSEGAGQLYETATGDSAGTPYARILGGIGAVVAPHTVRVAGRTRPDVAEKAATLRREGVTALSAGEATGKPTVQHLEEQYASEERMNLPLEQFTNAAMARVGMPVGRVNPQTLNQAYDRIGNQFERLSTRTRLDLNDPAIADNLLNDLVAAQTEYGHVLLNTDARAGLLKHVDDVLSLKDGAQYKALRSRVERVRRNTQDAEQGLFLASVVDAMDNAVEASMQKSAPELVGAWQEARNQYRNFLVIERAYNPMSDFIAPRALLGAISTQEGKRNLVLGRGSFADLAHAGTIMRQPRTRIAREMPVGPIHMAQKSLGGAALMSRPVQSVLRNVNANAAIPFLPSAAPQRSLLANVPENE